MALTFELEAEVRGGSGKSASRRLRREGKVPATLYGGSSEPVALAFDHNMIKDSLAHEAFYSHILTVKYDGKTEKALLKALQRNPSKPLINHMDLQRVSENTKVRMTVPLHFIGEDKAPGVKTAGGVVNHNLTAVEIICQAKDLPEFIEVDLSNLNANETVHLSDLKLPAGVQVSDLLKGADHDLPVATVAMPRGAAEEAAPAEAAAATPAA